MVVFESREKEWDFEGENCSGWFASLCVYI